MYPTGQKVKLNPAVLEDQSLKSNHHLLKRIIDEDREGAIREKDLVKSKPEDIRYWVKFHYAAILLSEKDLISK